MATTFLIFGILCGPNSLLLTILSSPGGDFNVILEGEDKAADLIIITQFNVSRIFHQGLLDLGFIGPKFTWSKIFGGGSHPHQA